MLKTLALQKQKQEFCKFKARRCLKKTNKQKDSDERKEGKEGGKQPENKNGKHWKQELNWLILGKTY